jgi:phosphotransferase system  glucose/maltose/N-acetylglucosamine-specific IIC component
MIWVGWRQQRVETLIAAAMVAVLAAVAIPAGIHMASVYTHEGLSACVRSPNPTTCGIPVSSFLFRFNGLNLLFVWSSLVPALAALLFAAPFVLDLDNGTHRLYWTQSITRRRWIVTKLTLSVVALVVVTGCLVALTTWSRAPLDHLNGRMSSNVYDIEGVVPLAYALFVLGVAVAIGALWRRAVPALLVAFVVYVIGRAFMDSWLRQRLLSPVKTTWLASTPGPNLNNALVIDQFASNEHGVQLGGSLRSTSTCSGHVAGFLSHTSTCVQAYPRGVHVYMTALYQPASRFWELQGVEFGIVAGIGVLLILAAAWWTQRRIA